MPKLALSINRPVIVTIPTFFGDGAARLCTLVDIEPVGLWVSGEAVSAQLAKEQNEALPRGAIDVVFVPFEQIGYVYDPAQAVYRARGAALRAGAKPGSPIDETHSATRAERSHSSRSRHKASKPAR
jgi:hypothetical protein